MNAGMHSSAAAAYPSEESVFISDVWSGGCALGLVWFQNKILYAA